MLKTFRGLVLVLVVLAGSAYVTPTYASSASIKMVQVQAGGPLSAADEGVVLYNNSSESQDISDWCLWNKNGVEFSCLTTGSPNLRIMLPGYSYAVIVSSPLAATMDSGQYIATYEPIHAGYGSITGGGDTITLVDDLKQEVDRLSWSTTLRSGYSWQRVSLGGLPKFYIDTNQASDWLQYAIPYPPNNQAEIIEAEEPIDVCANIPDFQFSIPEGYTLIEEGVCGNGEISGEGGGEQDGGGSDVDSPETSGGSVLSMRLSEMLPNVAGSDAGGEFIELYNSGSEDASLEGCSILTGKTLEKTVVLPSMTVPEGGFAVFYNSELAFSLLNTESLVALRCGETTLDQASYIDPKDDESWAVIDGVWQYTNMPTPGAPNVASLDDTSAVASSGSESSLKPCAANQYRSPETNRCRLLSSASSSSPKPCSEGQVRNPETNRCRKIAADDDGPKPCEEGQERNPETNRCRKIVKMSEVDYGVLGEAKESQEEGAWQLWIAIGGGLLVAFGYAAWEWRREFAKLFNKAKGLFRHGED